jgi:PAS domain S-box-containing protein
MRRSSAPLARESIDLSEAILDVAGSVILAMDREGRVIQWNQAACALTGILSDQIGGRVFSETLLFPPDIDDWRGEFDRICAGSAARYFKTRWKTRDGAVLSVTCSFSVIRDAAARVLTVVCTVVTSPGRTDRALLASEFQTDRTAELRDITRFLHDTIAQDLVALSFNLSRIEIMALDLTSQTPSDLTLD